MKCRDYQEKGIEDIRRAIVGGHRRVIFALPTGGGKCLGIGTEVLMYNGAVKRVEDVEVGDRLLGPDSRPRRVLSTCRGDGALFRIFPTKGEPWVCNDVHVLTLVHTETGEVVDIALDEYLKKSAHWRYCHKLFQPEHGVRFGDTHPSESALPIDPYFLGVWFGDGSKRLDTIIVHKPDQEIAEAVRATADAWGCNYSLRQYGDKCPGHAISTPRGAQNKLLTAMQALLNGDPYTVPQSVRVASTRERRLFLAGMIDTDGHVHNGSVEIVQKHRGIADGIAFIARSLGFKVATAIKTIGGASYFRMGLSGDFSDIPTRIQRKTVGERRQKKIATRTGFVVEPIGVGPYAGFELDGDGRFLLGDFTVTHNTVVASTMIRGAIAKGNKCIFVAHRRELIQQSYAKLIGCTCSKRYIHGGLMQDPTCAADGLPERDVGVIMGDDKRRRPYARAWVCSIDSLRNRKLPHDIGLIIIDEAHRCYARQYRELMDQYPEANIIGLTATPYRTDGKGLGEAGYTSIVVCSTVKALIERGYLVEPRVFTVPEDKLPDLTGVKVKKGPDGADYDRTQLAEAIDQKGLVGDIVRHWQEKAEGRRTVCFASSIEHSRHIVERFKEAGIVAEHLDGTTEKNERDAILRRIETGETLVVSNYGVLTEGWDQPSVKCCILARPTKSRGLCMQMAGRILRPWNGVGALILDHAGCIREHGFPQDEIEFSLESTVRNKRDKSESGVKTCPSCFACLPTATRECPVCHHDFIGEAAERGKVEEEDGDLVEAKPATMEEKRAYWDALCESVELSGYKIGWAFHRFKEKFGTFPPNTFPRPGDPRQPKVEASLDERVSYLLELQATAESRGYKPQWIGHRYKTMFGEWPSGLVLRAAATARQKSA